MTPQQRRIEALRKAIAAKPKMPFEEKKVGIWVYVKGKYVTQASKEIDELIQKYR